ncbi:YdcH family protein [Cohaesibacter gelatinilyticus]|uniref:GTP-binding protein n=1 Tax=Cohaesibacter gelatinilyticus TaxID=372072 RepID=A0A285NM62_9HYPH|nr:DUF465 domain-containing protein [Cohaesibacter gelatinilyticus]SNZ08946.1 hypothetical protein SAMN06265368_1880 [Cohaesibacter gelatinilyticus]HAT85812.1 DUF465 domain-containing protein [Hyphomicrobiales bacterium]
MSHVPHELHDEFPEYEQKLHDLKVNDAHFAKLSDEYHEVNREIHRIESEVEPTSDVYLEDQKKKRLMLLDQISNMLHA